MNAVCEINKRLTLYVVCCALFLKLLGAAVAQSVTTGMVPVRPFGHQLYYEMQGSGEPLVLIHGLTLDRRMWDAQFDLLSQKYRVIRYDMIGHGNSSGLAGPLANGSVRRWDYMRALLDALDVDKAHVIGLSMGAEVAIDFTLAYPERVQTLTSIDGSVAGYQWDSTSGEFADRVGQYYAVSSSQGVQATLPLWAADPLFAPAMADPVLRAQLEDLVINGHGALGAGAMFQWPNPRKLATLNPTAISRLHEIDVPTLVMVGELDLFDFQRQADILDQNIADSTKVVIAGAGHMASMEQPVAVNTILLDFLATHAIPEPALPILIVGAIPLLAAWRVTRRESPAVNGRLIRIGFQLGTFAWLVVIDPMVADSGAAPPVFRPGQAVGNIQMDEASGLAASRKNDGVFWVHNDSGDGPNIYAISSTGVYLGIYRLLGISARDWEDMAIGPGPVFGQSYLFLGDIGDNSAVRSTIQVHRVVEPTASPQQSPVQVTLSDFESFTFRYPDGPRDAESLMVDPLSGDILIISKRDPVPRIYRAAFPQSTSGTTTLEFVGLLSWTVNSPYDWPTAGDISPAGDEVLVRSYVGARLWPVPAGMTIADALSVPGYQVPLVLERQGEAIAFDANGWNYYSVSEGSGEPFYRYERVPEPSGLAMICVAVGTLSIALRRRHRRNPRPVDAG